MTQIRFDASAQVDDLAPVSAGDTRLQRVRTSTFIPHLRRSNSWIQWGAQKSSTLIVRLLPCCLRRPCRLQDAAGSPAAARGSAACRHTNVGSSTKQHIERSTNTGFYLNCINWDMKPAEFSNGLTNTVFEASDHSSSASWLHVALCVYQANPSEHSCKETCYLLSRCHFLPMWPCSRGCLSNVVVST